jgi:SAM-dependent methyltransferase
MPRPSQLATFYPADYHSMQGQGLLARIKYAQRVKRLESLVRSADGPWLDYGCGDGQFLSYAAQHSPSRRYFGYEIAERNEVRQLVSGAVTIVSGDFEFLLRLLPQCQLITMNHVIEHLPYPIETLTELRAKLAPGGLLEGQTPAAGSLEHRVFRNRWSGYHAPRHTVVFSPVGLRRLLLRVDFTSVEVGGAFNPAGLAVSLASLTQSAAGGSIKRTGVGWLFWLALATALSPIDLLSGSRGIMNFACRRPEV